jgi:hypothetical protein
VPPRESYFEATGHSRGRAVFRALQRLFQALEALRYFFPLVAPAALSKSAARNCHQKTPQDNSAAALSMVAVSSPSPRRGRSLPLRSRAILHETVTATAVDIGYALIAAANRTWTGVPFPRCPRSVLLGRIIRVNVRVDIGLRIRRLDPDDHRQGAQATDQSALHDFLL